MRQSVLAVGVIFCALANQDALAQDFWYATPGYDYGYYYGIDLGNGVGYGYGLGVGIPLPLGALTGSKTAAVPQVQDFCCDEVVAPTTSAVDPAIATIVPLKTKSPAKLNAKKSEKKVQQPKPVTESKASKTPTHMTAKNGQAT